MKYLFPILLLISVNLPAQEDSLLHFKLLFVGDVMQHKPQIKAAEIIPNKSYDYESCFKYVSPIIKKADLAIGNLEVTLPGKPPYQGYPQFRSPDDLALGLRLAGFDMMVTSNNHSNDAGKMGLINTIETLKNYGFYQTGTFKNQEERTLFYPLIIYKDNFKLGFLNYTYDTNGLKTKPPTVVNYIDTMQMKKDLDLANLINPDFTIVFMHWGKEYKLIESKKQRWLAQWLFKNGADLVIGAHPHVVQPIKLLPKQPATSNQQPATSNQQPATSNQQPATSNQQPATSNQQPATSNLVVYSMGNFISNQTKANTDGGIMVEIDLTKNAKSNQTWLSHHQYIPVWRYIQKDKKGKRKYFAIPVAAFENGKASLLKMNSKDITAMKTFAKKTRAHLNKYDGVERLVSFEEVWESGSRQ